MNRAGEKSEPREMARIDSNSGKVNLRDECEWRMETKEERSEPGVNRVNIEGGEQHW